MDLAKRIQDMRSVLAVFDNFDDRGLDEQPLAAMQLLRVVDQDEAAWTHAISRVLVSLNLMHANTNWLRVQTEREVAYTIDVLADRLVLVKA